MRRFREFLKLLQFVHSNMIDYTDREGIRNHSIAQLWKFIPDIILIKSTVEQPRSQTCLNDSTLKLRFCYTLTQG